jgi:hypothetical protein
MANMTIFPTGLTYSRNTKAPLESNRLFDTLALAQAYVNDKDQTAYIGMTISVIADGENNGLYYVERIADTNNETGFLKKVGSDTGSLNEDVASIKAKVDALPETIVSDVKVNGVSVVTTGVANIDLSDYAKTINVAAKSDFDTLSAKVGSAEESTGIYKLVSDTAATLRNEMSVIPKFSIQVVEALPVSNQSVTTVYLVKDKDIEGDLYTEYIFVNGTWENLGKQRLDLSAYSTTEAMNTAIANAVASYVKTSELNTYKTEVSEALGLKANSADVYSKNDANSTFVKVSGYVAYSQSEKDKLNSISEGAEANIINTVKVKTVDGENAISVTDKSVTIDLSPYAKAVNVYTKEESNSLLDGKLNSDVTVNGRSFANNAVVLDSSDIKLSSAVVRVVDGEEQDVYTTDNTVHGVIADLSARIDNVNTIVNGQVTGVASVSAGVGISVTGDKSSPVVSVKVAENSAIKATENGLDIM